jgi:hypothetical protein
MIACEKIDNDIVLPESLPMQLIPLEKRFINENHYLQSLVVFDSSRNEDVAILLEQSKIFLQDESALAIAFLTKDIYNCFDQINFMKTHYKELQQVHLLPFYKDINNNGSKDICFFLDFEDSLAVGVFDIILPKNERWIRWLSLSRDDGNYLVFLANWENPKDNTSNIVFRKSNRLTGKSLHVDTVYCYDLSKEVIKYKFPFGAQLLKSIKIPINDSTLFFHTTVTGNGTSHLGFTDNREYIVCFSDKGDLIWADTVSEVDSRSYNNYYENIENEYFISSTVYDNKKTQISYYNALSNKPILKKDLLKYQSLIRTLDSGNHLLFQNLDNYSLEKWNKDLEIVIKRVFPFLIKRESSDILFGGLENQTDRHYNINSFDINKDGYEEFLILTSSNQLLCLNGKTLDVLFASQKHSEPFSSSFLRTKEG